MYGLPCACRDLQWLRRSIEPAVASDGADLRFLHDAIGDRAGSVPAGDQNPGFAAFSIEVQGERPWSAWKIAGAVLVILTLLLIWFFLSPSCLGTKDP